MIERFEFGAGFLQRTHGLFLHAVGGFGFTF
jgi:hypothetical protein